MSESIGLVSCVQRQSAFLDGQMQRDCSEATARDIDEEVKVLLDHAYGDAKQAVIRAVKIELDESGIGIPFPQLDLHLDPPEAETARRAA